jgi:hypothetical protein|tara:strand:- start:215 stop:559 length:345 start_codon:yes stop_codon:yes gene_type:complete
MRGKIIWRCEECEQELHYKGLCRECTEYDSEGNVLNPVRRVKINKVINSSNHTHNRIVNNINMPSPLLQGSRGYRSKRKLTKKQVKNLENQLSSLAPKQDGKFTLLGESDDSEE